MSDFEQDDNKTPEPKPIQDNTPPPDENDNPQVMAVPLLNAIKDTPDETPVSEVYLQDEFTPDNMAESVVADEPLHDEDASVLTLAEFEELTLLEALRKFFRAPLATVEAIWWVARPQTRPLTPDLRTTLSVNEAHATTASEVSEDDAEREARPETDNDNLLETPQEPLFAPVDRVGLVLSGVAFLLVLAGTLTFIQDDPQRRESLQLAAGLPFVFLGLLLWGFNEVRSRWDSLQVWWQERTSQERYRLFMGVFVGVIVLWGVMYFLDASDDALITPQDNADVLQKVSQGVSWLLMAFALWVGGYAFSWWRSRTSPRQSYVQETPPADNEETVITEEQALLDLALPIQAPPQKEGAFLALQGVLASWEAAFHPLRLVFALVATICSTLVWLGSAGNEIETPTLYLWLLSVLMWAWVFSPRRWWRVTQWGREAWKRLGAFSLMQHRMILLVLVALVIGAFYLRTTHFYGEAYLGTAVPPEMTSDHVEKILDAQRVKEGSRNIFFANNGGREPFQMYVLAFISSVTGQPVNYDLLKTLAVLESLITLPFFFWLGRVVVGQKHKQFGVIFGLVLVGVLAFSYWHLTITRLSLRIVLTPLVTALLLIALIKALRTGRIGYYILAGVILGFGLYTYQAVRMLPVIALIAVGLALVYAQDWRTRWQTLANLGALVLVAFVAFLPLFHYSVENPDQFWRRTAGRVLGDEVVEERLPDGRVIERIATLTDRIQAFNQNIPVLLSNLRNSVLMFNWKGDVAWINNYPNHPALDAFMGAFFLLGLVAWLFWLSRDRDPARWLVLLALPVMLLPSALSIAYPIENPSFTRSSGALPSALLLVALPLTMLIERGLQSRVVGRWGVTLFVGVVLLGSVSQTTTVYFTKFPTTYADASLPYSDAGRVLRAFVVAEGGFGNAYMIAYPYWWDHRAIGLAAGIEGKWENGVYDNDPFDNKSRDVDYVPAFMNQAFSASFIRYRYDPERPLLFFYSPNDTVTEAQLKLWFPQGIATRHPSYQRNDEFMTYRVPPLGVDGFVELITTTTTP